MKLRIALGAVLQLVTLAALLLTGYLPLLESRPGSAVARCLGSHDLCGCAPDRIAAKTCCCSQQQSSCCDTEDEEVAGSAGSDDHAGQPGLHLAPCGDGAKFLDPGSIDLALNLTPTGSTPHNGWRALNYPCGSFKQPGGLAPEPPEPPPKVQQHT